MIAILLAFDVQHDLAIPDDSQRLLRTALQDQRRVLGLTMEDLVEVHLPYHAV